VVLLELYDREQIDHLMVTGSSTYKGQNMANTRLNTTTFAKKSLRILHDWIPSLVLISFMLIARSTLADHYYVPSGSMEPTLMPGDHVVVNKSAYGLRVPFTNQVIALQENPQRGEVVIFDSPENDVRLIKRVVAVGGDKVSVIKGRVVINGQFLVTPQNPIIEVYGSREARLNLADGGGPDLPELQVPQDHVLVLGDHRGNSHDGRFFGTVPVGELYGRATGVFLRQSDGLIWQSL
jgi:signal peptidase I